MLRFEESQGAYSSAENSRIAVVIPCYKVTRHILGVIAAIGREVWRIYVIDDKCPDESGNYVAANCTDPRVVVLRHEVNQGVGGAVITGYQAAISIGAQVIVKIDGDGQMDPAQISYFTRPILDGKADYTKGNRFFNVEYLASMPKIRILGNSFLSLVNKFSSGFWDVMDPTNGYTAIHVGALRLMGFEKVDRRYFFEADILFRLNTVRAVVKDIPLAAHYENQTSSMNLVLVAIQFPWKYLRIFVKRIFYNYFLRDFNAGTVELCLGLPMVIFGLFYGAVFWARSNLSGVEASSGSVMVAALPILLGFQLLISFINYDISNVPKDPIHKMI